jgi:hypothetical protein
MHPLYHSSVHTAHSVHPKLPHHQYLSPPLPPLLSSSIHLSRQQISQIRRRTSPRHEPLLSTLTLCTLPTLPLTFLLSLVSILRRHWPIIMIIQHYIKTPPPILPLPLSSTIPLQRRRLLGRKSSPGTTRQLGIPLARARPQQRTRRHAATLPRARRRLIPRLAGLGRRIAGPWQALRIQCSAVLSRALWRGIGAGRWAVGVKTR